MTLGSGCANKTLIRIGGGSLRSLIVFIVLGISAYMTIKGLPAQRRATLLDPVSINLANWGMAGQDLPTVLTRTIGTRRNATLLMSMAVISGGLLVFVFKDARFRRNRSQLLGDVVIGLVVAAG
jgi:hypothetical protein